MTTTKTYTVTPINDIKGNMDKFDWAYSHLEICTFPTPVTEILGIELIKCKVGSTEAVLAEIAERGYSPAPSPYVLGLGVQHPAVIKEYGYIVSLDENNVLRDGNGDPCFLLLGWGGERRLDLARRAGGWDGFWWFAVVRKEPKTLNPQPLDTQILNALTLLKSNGFKITRLEEKEF